MTIISKSMKLSMLDLALLKVIIDLGGIIIQFAS